MQQHDGPQTSHAHSCIFTATVQGKHTERLIHHLQAARATQGKIDGGNKQMGWPEDGWEWWMVAGVLTSKCPSSHSSPSCGYHPTQKKGYTSRQMLPTWFDYILAYQTQARETCKNMWEQNTPHHLLPFLLYLFLHPATLDVDVMMSGALTSQLLC